MRFEFGSGWDPEWVHAKGLPISKETHTALARYEILNQQDTGDDAVKLRDKYTGALLSPGDGVHNLETNKRWGQALQQHITPAMRPRRGV